MNFRKYMHIERFGSDEVQGIELGECYVFPKIDGSNGSIWLGDKGVECGSRNRKLDIGSDNAGFYAWATSPESPDFDKCLSGTGCRLYGEWLVPHSLKTYREDAWRRFYVFDVYSDVEDRFLSYAEYEPMLKEHGIDYIPPVCVMRNTTYDNLLVELENNVFLIQEGKGCGEGIVIKNYSFVNRFGNVVWAKMITNKFKEKHAKEMGATVKNMKQMTEQAICDEYVTQHLVDKVYSKIVNENQGWNSRYIPQLLGSVYYDLVKEETWDFVKKHKNPTVNFKTLNSLAIMKIKELRPELF